MEQYCRKFWFDRFFYLGAILTLKNLLDTRCQLNKELVLDYLNEYKNIDEVSTEVKDVIDAVIKEYKDIKER